MRSYVEDRWVEPTEQGVPVHDATTAAVITRVSSAGIDLAAALEHGRRVGGAELRSLTFHERAAILKNVGVHLREHRPELYQLSARAGATLSDARFDVDGGIGVLLGYASKAKRELPAGSVYVEGPAELLGRGGAFVGQHVLTSRHGVAVQINAFNFPVWGPLEKFAPAFLAGVPTLVKPATQTAYLTARLVELIVSSGLLPPGSLQLVCGGVSGLARSPRRPGSVVVHRLRGHRAETAQPPERRRTRCAFQRRSRFAELLAAGTGRSARHA